ncbi:MAG: methyltransferase [Bacteroidaceae bacterium]
MANTYFEFKQFRVNHDQTAMKVGTDGVLLGAWAQHDTPKNILDIGTGSGLVAIMLAQRYEARILGIDIDTDACLQASKNAKQSPWSERLYIEQADVLTFNPHLTFDLIVCNPPFYENALCSPNQKRTIARCAHVLPFDKLIKKTTALLSQNGTFCVILPCAAVQNFVHLCWINNLHLSRCTHVHTKVGKTAKRSLLSFRTTHITTPILHELLLTGSDHKPTEEYKNLTQDYYLEQYIGK